MDTNSSHLQQTLDILDVLMQSTGEMTLAELELLEESMTTALKENVAEAIARKQVLTVIEGYALDPILPDGFSVTQTTSGPKATVSGGTGPTSSPGRTAIRLITGCIAWTAAHGIAPPGGERRNPWKPLWKSAATAGPELIACSAETPKTNTRYIGIAPWKARHLQKNK